MRHVAYLFCETGKNSWGGYSDVDGKKWLVDVMSNDQPSSNDRDEYARDPESWL